MTAQNGGGLPEYATFVKMAEILRELGLSPTATADTVRYAARKYHDDWPVGDEGEGKPHTYARFGNARAMPPAPVIEFYKRNPPGHRGPDRKPRQRRSKS